jgi:hypothetical protein
MPFSMNAQGREHMPAVIEFVDVDADQEDSHWRAAFRRERYYRDQLDYEDYAPAYCVGYTGCAQYGGCFEEAEKSLWANWERIKGDSRLRLEEARLAMRAAWDRMTVRRVTADVADGR